MPFVTYYVTNPFAGSSDVVTARGALNASGANLAGQSDGRVGRTVTHLLVDDAQLAEKLQSFIDGLTF